MKIQLPIDREYHNSIAFRGHADIKRTESYKGEVNILVSQNGQKTVSFNIDANELMKALQALI